MPLKVAKQIGKGRPHLQLRAEFQGRVPKLADWQRVHGAAKANNTYGTFSAAEKSRLNGDNEDDSNHVDADGSDHGAAHQNIFKKKKNVSRGHCGTK